MRRPSISGNTIRIPPDLKYLTDVDEFVEGFLQGCGADEAVIADIAISVSELVTNAVSHGSKVQPDATIVVAINKADSKVTVIVSDRGAGFDPDDIDDPLADENLLKETGRGIFIVRSLMDTMDIKAGEHGTTITITKKL